jgi:UDP-N-acetylglucosamine acyltransferase
MDKVHIPHDAQVQDQVVITPMVVLAGCTRVLQGATLGIGCGLHQYTVVGQYAMIGMGAVVTKNVRPFSKFIPGRDVSVNDYALDKFGFEEHVDEIYKYVLEDRAPESDRVVALVEHYVKHHEKSSRDQY